MGKRIVHRVDWRKHIIPNHHSWISEYMDTHGVEFYSRVVSILLMNLGNTTNHIVWLQPFSEFNVNRSKQSRL